MSNGNPGQQTKRERQRARAEAKRQAERKAQQRRTLGWALGGLALIGVVVALVVAFMGGDGDGAGPSAQGQVTVDGSSRATALQPGEAVPAFSAPDLFGGTVSWDDYAGSPAVLSVWASWCSHCQAELPVLDRVMEDYPGVGWLTIVTSIGTQPGPTPEEYMTDNSLSFPVAVDDDEGTLAAAYGIEGFPTLYFVNSDGTVGTTLTGEVPEGTIRSTIDSLS